MDILLFTTTVSVWQLDSNTPLIPYIIYYSTPPSLSLYPLIDIYRPLFAVLKA